VQQSGVAGQQPFTTPAAMPARSQAPSTGATPYALTSSSIRRAGLFDGEGDDEQPAAAAEVIPRALMVLQDRAAPGVRKAHALREVRRGQAHHG
jgi:hypothetical protein